MMIDTDTLTIELENAPAIKGLKFRGFRGPEDYPNMLAVLQASVDGDDLDESYNLKDLQNFYEHLNRCDPYRDMLFAEVEGELAGFGRTDWAEQMNGEIVYNLLLRVSPIWRGQGLEKAMFAYLKAHAKKVAATHAADSQKYWRVWAEKREAWLSQLFLEDGFEEVRYIFSMKRLCSEALLPPQLPDGFEVRPVSESQIRQVWEADQEFFKEHWGYTPGTEKDFESWQQWSAFNPALWKVAWEGENIVGMVLNFIDHQENQYFKRRRGYTENISVHKNYRKRGIARALLGMSIQMFQEMGMEETALSVDTENPSGALRLYVSMGYKEANKVSFYKKPFM